MADDRIAEDVMQGDFVRTMRKMALKDSNDSIRLMTIGNTGGWRNFANTKRRIANPSDMKGLKIRTVVATTVLIFKPFISDGFAILLFVFAKFLHPPVFPIVINLIESLESFRAIFLIVLTKSPCITSSAILSSAIR